MKKYNPIIVDEILKNKIDISKMKEPSFLMALTAHQNMLIEQMRVCMLF